MIPTMWRGHDGTVYAVVGALAVRAEQPRWWLDEVPESGDRVCGPATPARLHKIPAKKISDEIRYALVLPEPDHS